MITRISRRNLSLDDLDFVYRSTNKEIVFMGKTITVNTGIPDMLDNDFKTTFRINDAMYDYISEKGTDEELDALTTEAKTFGDKRKMILSLNKLTKQYYDDISQLETILNDLSDIN